MMNIKFVTSLIYVFIVLPIFLYLLYYLLVAVHAGELEMFLFWVYVPFSMFVSLIIRILEGN